MQLTEQQAIAVAKFPAALQDLIATELSAGNAIAEIGSGFPAPPIGAWLKLARPITTRPGSSDARLDFRERNNSLYSSEITDQTRLFFVLEPPKPPASLSEEPTTCPATRSEEVTTASSQSRPTKRSLFVTIVGCLAIVAGALASTISFMSVLMLLAGGHGTAAGLTPEGILLILLPPATLAAGIGFVLRQRWAYLFVLILLSTSFAISAHRLLKGPIPRTTYISASGVTTTILPSTGTESIPVIIVSGGLLATLLARRIRSEFGWARSTPAAPCPTQEWRVGHIGRDRMYYEERHGNSWKRLDIDGEMLTGRAHHIIYFPSPQTWSAYPDWVRGRRDEIIARVKSRFSPPDYEYHGDL